MIDFSKQRAAAKWSEDVERRKRASRYIDYYRNNQTEHLTDILHKLYPKEWDMMSKYATTYALTSALIDDMALVFQTPADISIEANDAQQDKLAELIDQSHLPTRLIQADRYAELLIDEKRAFLEDKVARNVHLFFTHDPGCALAQVTRDEKGKFGTAHEHAELHARAMAA